MKAYNSPTDELHIKSNSGEELVKITPNETKIKNMDLSSLGIESTPEEVNAAVDYVDDLTVSADKVNTAASTIDQAFRPGMEYISCVPSAQVYSQINGINFASETYSEYDFGNIHTTLIPKEGHATSPDYLTKTIPLTIQLSTAITQSLFSTGTATASLFDVEGFDGIILLVDRELKLEIGYSVMPLHYMGFTVGGFVFQGGIYLSNLGATVPDGYYYFEVIFSNHSPSSNTSVTFNVHYFSPDTLI
jgi:hypothetical protein